MRDVNECMRVAAQTQAFEPGLICGAMSLLIKDKGWARLHPRRAINEPYEYLVG